MENTQLLHSRRLLFRKFRQDDKLEELDVFNHKNYNFFGKEKVKNQSQYIDQIIENYEKEKDYNFWHIVKVGENKSIGLAKLIAYDDYFEIKILINEKFENRGYATEALTTLIHEFLTENRFKEVILKAEKENKNWQEVIKKAHINKYKEENDYIYYKLTNLEYMKYFAIYGDI